MSKYKQKTTGRNVETELMRRSECRYGLRDVRIGHKGNVYVCDGSEWDRHGKLVLDLRPEGMTKDDVDRVAFPPGVYERVRKGRVVTKSYAPNPIGIGDLLRMTDEVPEGYLRNVPASECTLLSDWPAVCRCW